jgi:nucleolar protein 6
MQHALKLHHSMMGKRKINVELTAGGGGTSDARKAKIEAQRKKLSAQREKRVTALKEEKDKKRKERVDKAAEMPAAAKSKKMPWLSGPNATRLG